MPTAGGFDLVTQGMSGLMSITGEGPGCPPVKIGRAPVTDITAGILGCVGVLAALHSRASTGQGQMVDTSLFEAGIIHTLLAVGHLLCDRAERRGDGDGPPAECALSGLSGGRRLDHRRSREPGQIGCGCLRRSEAPELGNDPRFVNNAERMRKSCQLLQAALTHLFKGRSSAEWLQRLEEAGVPAGPVLDVGQMHARSAGAGEGD